LLYSNGWRAYGQLRDLNYNHYVVIYEENFVAPGNVVVGDRVLCVHTHTQNVENRWKVVKQFLRRRAGMRRAHLDR
jgi:hypothetical protein